MLCHDLPHIFTEPAICCDAVTAILKSMKVDTISPKGFVIFEENELQVGPYQSSPLPIFDSMLIKQCKNHFKMFHIT